MGHWVELTDEDLAALDPGQSTEERGVAVHVFMSPFDVPQAVRGRFDQERDRFIIEFRYISEEPWTEQPSDDGSVTLRVGRHSGRLYAILVDVQRIGADQVNLRLHKPKAAADTIRGALDRFTERPQSQRRRDNYRLAEEVISRKESDIFESLMPA